MEKKDKEQGSSSDPDKSNAAKSPDVPGIADMIEDRPVYPDGEDLKISGEDTILLLDELINGKDIPEGAREEARAVAREYNLDL